MSAGMLWARPQIPCAWLHAHSWIMLATVRIVLSLFGPTSSKRTGNVSVKTRPCSINARLCQCGMSSDASTNASSVAIAAGLKGPRRDEPPGAPPSGAAPRREPRGGATSAARRGGGRSKIARIRACRAVPPPARRDARRRERAAARAPGTPRRASPSGRRERTPGSARAAKRARQCGSGDARGVRPANAAGRDADIPRQRRAARERRGLRLWASDFARGRGKRPSTDSRMPSWHFGKNRPVRKPLRADARSIRGD